MKLFRVHLVQVLFVLTLLAGVLHSQVAAAATPTPMPTPTPVEYVLPYPGILPTHPLYLFKMLRDRIIEAMITDPVSKSEFYVLQADKKLGMGVLLMLKKSDDAKETFADAVANREKAVTSLETLKKAGGEIPEHTREKLALSLLKHREVLHNIGLDTSAVEALSSRVDALAKTE